MSKDNKTFRDNLKHILRSFSKGSLNNVVSRSDIVLSEEIEQDVRKESSMSTRLKAFKELAESLNGNKLEDKATEKLWFHVEDLLQKQQTKEVRSVGFHFLKTLIKTQSEQLNLLRGHFFRVIKDMEDPDDALDRFELLNLLTENGKNVLYFEEEIGPFMLKWMKNMAGFSPGKIQEFLLLLVNVIKFNAGYLDEQIITGIIRQVYTVCFFPAVLVCLQVLDTIVCYSYIPTESLSDFIGILCHTVNGEVYCQNSAKVMRNLLGTYMGHSTINKLCTFLREPMFQKNELLLRGAICFTSMALWGHNHIQSLLIHQNTVLLSFIDVLKTKEQLVTFEIILNVQRLIYKHGHELHDPVWDSILTILQLISELIDNSENENKKLNADMSKYLYDSMTCIDKLIENQQFNGSIVQFFSIVANNPKKKPNHLIYKLIVYLSSSITPIKPDWLKKLKLLLKVFLLEEHRSEIQLKALDVLKDVFVFNKLCYEKELFDEIVCPCFQKMPLQMETDVKIEITIFLINSISNYDSKYCSNVLNIIEQISELSISNCKLYTETVNELKFIHIFVKRMIELFSVKLHHYPASNAAKIFYLLVRHLDFQYQIVNDYHLANNIRYDLLEFFLKIRANLNGLCGICRKKGIIKYSACLKVIDERETNFVQFPMEGGKTTKSIDHISLRKPFILFITCLNKEIATKNILLVLNEITELLQNRAISISKLEKNEIDMLVLTSFALITENRLKTFDLHDPVFMLLANLTSFHDHLNENRKESIISFLIKFGLVSKRVMFCLIALTACAVEIKDSIVVFLPEILLALSKISPTVHISIPVLEFLSTLIRHSSLYSNFACDQYMYVFAISLPYTNPFKYNHYIVSLAHHVIAVWFLKCQLSYRRDFVKFITTGLQSNVLNQFSEESIKNFTEKSFINEDSSNRKRSSSLTEQSYRRNEYSRIQPKTINSLSTMSSPKSSIKVIGDSVLVQFYEELTETCIDLMARYTYSLCSPLPTRSPVTEFLLKNGNSQTWLIGNKIVTITTSGCAQTVSKNGLCEKCRLFCSKIDEQKSNKKHVQFNTEEVEDKQNEKQMGMVSDQVEKLILQSKCDNLEKSLCACWCQGWAEIYIRRPTGDTAWTLKIQNSINYQPYKHDFPLQDLSTLYMESLTKNQFMNSSDFEELSLKQHSSDENSNYNINDGSSAIDNLLESKTRNPVRRSNSSPEMSSSWKNPFLANTNIKHSQNSNISEESDANLKKKNYQHDLRVSWEAIPEEITSCGTTPPLFDQIKNSNLELTDDQISSILPETSVEIGKLPKMKKFNINSKTEEMFTSLSSTKAVAAAAAAAVATAKNTWTHEPDSGSNRVDSKVSISFVERPTSLPSFTSNVAKLPSKPPQNLISMNVAPPEINNETVCENIVLSPISRDRGHTISVMSPARIQRKENVKNAPVTTNCDFLKSGINPSFIFLQLYHSSVFGSERPLLVSSHNSDVFERSLKVLDRMPPFETHKVGVVYVGVNQCHSETEILRNRFGSLRYLYFLNGLGSMISLTNVDPRTCYLGGLECNGDHGKFAYSWQDDVMQVIFHVATLMPCKDNDPRCTNKKMHIGNNYVTIVYNESGDDYNFGTINSQFNYVSIIIVPMDHKTNKIIIKAKNDLSKQMGFSEARIVSDDNLAVLVRQLALHANLVSMISKSLTIKGGEPYASNWLERLRKIKATRQKLLIDNNGCDSHFNLVSNASNTDSSKNSNNQIDDFTSYT